MKQNYQYLKKWKILSLLLIWSGTALAQASPIENRRLQAAEIPQDIIPPSPTVEALMRFEEVPVDLYTGIPQIAIPVFSKPVGSGVNLGLTLNYNPSGLRIEERSSCTGRGWSLFAGGDTSKIELSNSSFNRNLLFTGIAAFLLFFVVYMRIMKARSQ
ncbi:MAG: hypothetical protein AAFX87_31035 [Bacteroidota bacterium]